MLWQIKQQDRRGLDPKRSGATILSLDYLLRNLFTEITFPAYLSCCTLESRTDRAPMIFYCFATFSSISVSQKMTLNSHL